jgi:outer membrane protein OmpA-like peptidoglycan-associated protein
MSDRRRSAWAAALTVSLASAGCGPSNAELAAREQQAMQQRELAETRQYNEDLKFRLQLAQARNKLLLGLVQGLTVDPDHFAPAPEKLAVADASLQSIDRDVEALIATVRTSRESAASLRDQREALQRELADARHTIENARAAQAGVDARMLALQRILAPLSPLVKSGRVNVSIVFGLFSIAVPEAALFAQNQASLSEDGKSLLERVVTGLRTSPERQARVTGPADAIGKRASAQRELTLARSVAVLEYLRTHGVTAESAVTTTHQQEQLPASDRFFAISLVPTADELPKLPSPDQLLTSEPQ